jgi:hypothetical protein
LRRLQAQRHQVVLTWPAEEIDNKLIEMDETKLRWVYALVSDHFKNHPCETCNGTGWHVRQSVPGHVELDGSSDHGPFESDRI